MTGSINTGLGFNKTATLAAAYKRLEQHVEAGRMTGAEADRRAFKLIASLRGKP